MSQVEEFRERLRTDTPLWGREVGQIVNKERQRVPFFLNEGQMEFWRKVEEQRKADRPRRAIILKARRLGFSTLVQGMLIQMATMTANYHTAVVAHDRETGGKLYRMGRHFYANLPAELRPEIASHRRSQFLHFADRGDGWMKGLETWPDSSYYVDTAGETDAGRGGEYAAIHGSEVAFWADFVTKLTALQSTVPDDPETMLFLESTANGHNDFKDFWDDAVDGRNEYIPFFWPWWKDETYVRPFLNEREREMFIVGDGPYGEDEQDLMERFGLSLEQLNWRRYTIANKTAGRLDKFKQEYPSFPEEAFITSGSRVFDPKIVSGILVACDITDPKQPSAEHPGPERGEIRPSRWDVVGSERGGRVERPAEPEWVPEPGGNWRIWYPDGADRTTLPIAEDDQFVIGVDVSGGERKGTTEPAWHAIQVINHKTREQVAEYRSRIDPDLLANECILAGLLFNNAWLAIEITGSYGMPVARKVWLDYGYPQTYFRHSMDDKRQREKAQFGWDTSARTKPLMVATATQLLREGEHGVRSRVLAGEMLTYARDPETGKMEPEPGKFSDALMAWMIAQQVGQETPIRVPRRKGPRRQRVLDPVTGY